MPMSPRLLRPLASTGFSPLSIAGLGAWFDASDLSTLSQTSDGTTPVTSNSDPVAYWKDKVTGVALTQAIDANRPLWLADGIGGKPGLDFDGSNDVLSATSGSLMGLFRNVGAGTVITAHRFKSTTPALGFVFFTSTGTSSTAGRFALTRESSIGTRYSLGSRRTDAQSGASVLTNAGTLTTNATISASIYRVSAAQVSFRLDGGVILANASFQNAGNTSDTNSQQVAIGGVSGSSVFADLVMCEMLAWPRELTLAEIQTVERYLSRRYGVALA
jgi:hypothetical protein